MKYVCLVSLEQDKRHAVPDSECTVCGDGFRKSGLLVAAEGGSKERCGWLKDKYGPSWQVVPTVLGTLLGDKDAAKVHNVVQAMLKMTKLDIEGLQRAYAEVV